MCLEKAVKSRNGQRGPRILFQYFNKTQQAAWKSSDSFSSRIHGYYYTIRDDSIILFYFILFKLHSSENVLSPQKHEAGTIVKRCPETTLVCGLRGCRWSPCGPASRLRSARFISFLVGPFGVHQQSGIR